MKPIGRYRCLAVACISRTTISPASPAPYTSTGSSVASLHMPRCDTPIDSACSARPIESRELSTKRRMVGHILLSLTLHWELWP